MPRKRTFLCFIFLYSFVGFGFEYTKEVPFHLELNQLQSLLDQNDHLLRRIKILPVSDMRPGKLPSERDLKVLDEYKKAVYLLLENNKKMKVWGKKPLTEDQMLGFRNQSRLGNLQDRFDEQYLALQKIFNYESVIGALD